MKNNTFVSKVFIATTVVFATVLVVQFIFQNLYFESFYIHKKQDQLVQEMTRLREHINQIEVEEEINHILFEYAQNSGISMGIMNLYGIPIYGFNTDTTEAFVDIIDSFGYSYRVYLYQFKEDEVFVNELANANEISVRGRVIRNKHLGIYPEYIQLDGKNYIKEKDEAFRETLLPKETINKIIGSYGENLYTGNSNAVNYINPFLLGIMDAVEVEGVIEYVYMPSTVNYGMEYREDRIIKDVSNLIATSTELSNIFEEDSYRIYENIDTFTGINNMIAIFPINIEGEPMFFVGMVSLQPIEEAIAIIKNYFNITYIIGSIIGVIIAYLYARRITKPLVALNSVTKQLAELNFSDACEENGQDEVATLAKNINKMSTKLEETLSELKEDIRQKERVDEQRKHFLANISHELKTPLTVLRGTCEGLVDGVYAQDQHLHYQVMLNQINTMGEMISELLEISRLDQEEELVCRPFDLLEVFLKVHAQLKPLCVEKQLKIDMDITSGIVVADEKKIETVLRNVYNNAIFYTPNNKAIRIVFKEQESWIKVSIENTGVFIDEKEINKLWEAFYTLNHSRNRKLGGSGLGLYIVKQILEKHEVTFGLENTKEGVEVCFLLPKYDLTEEDVV